MSGSEGPALRCSRKRENCDGGGITFRVSVAWRGARPIVVVSIVVFRHRNVWLGTVVWRCWILKVSPAFFGVIVSALDLPNSPKILTVFLGF